MRFLLVTMFVLLSAQMFHAQSVAVPDEVRTALNKAYPGWKFSQLDPEIKKYLDGYAPDAQPNAMSGDFDGDGQMDFAMLIEHQNFNDPGKSYTHVMEFLAFVKRAKGYERFNLSESQAADPTIFMTLAKKGAKSSEFETGREFVYKNDSISVSYWEKAGGTYMYRKGKFIYVNESD